MFHFIVIELQKLECKQHPAIRTLRKALSRQRDDLLAFAGILERKRPTSNPYWERWNQLHSQLSGQFHGVMKAVAEALKQAPRASSLVENLNCRLQHYFFLRRNLNDSYLGLLQFFLNHRCFIRSQVAQRVEESPRELMTGETHPYWLEMLGFQRFQRA
ncbi:MAG: hypothetical protein AB4050_11495 [Synechococcus sp.]